MSAKALIFYALCAITGVLFAIGVQLSRIAAILESKL